MGAMPTARRGHALPDMPIQSCETVRKFDERIIGLLALRRAEGNSPGLLARGIRPPLFATPKPPHGGDGEARRTVFLSPACGGFEEMSGPPDPGLKSWAILGGPSGAKK